MTGLRLGLHLAARSERRRAIAATLFISRPERPILRQRKSVPLYHDSRLQHALFGGRLGALLAAHSVFIRIGLERRAAGFHYRTLGFG